MSIENLTWGIIASTIFFYTYPILSNYDLAGWDTIGHRYLYERMIDTLSLQNKVYSYDTYWYGGYSTFALYPPFFYFVISLVYFITFGLVSKTLVFNIITFLLPFLFLLSIRYSTKIIIGKNAIPYALIFAFVFLMYPIDSPHLGIGLVGILFMGFLPQYFAISIFLIFFTQLYCLNQASDYKRILSLSILLAIIIYTHILTSVFTLIVIFLYLIFNLNLSKKIFLFSSIAILLASPWLYKFLEYLPYSSGRVMGLEGFKDPFLVLFPRLEAIFTSLAGDIPSSDILIQIGSFTKIFSISPIIIFFPYFTVIAFVCCAYGLLNLIKSKDKWLAYAFIIFFILFPRNIFTELVNLNIHYYRFISYLLVLNIFIITFGALRLRQEILEIKNLKIQFVCNLIFTSLLVIVIMQSSFFSLTWNKKNYFGHFEGYNPSFKLTTSSYDNHKSIKEVKDFFKAHKAKGRIFVESTGHAVHNFGSPHYLQSKLPLELDIEILPGLIAESAMSSSFVNGAIATKSEHMGWGRNPFTRNDFINQSFSHTIKRLALFNTQYIISFSKTFDNYLKKSNLVEQVFSIKPINIYEIKDFQPKVIETNVKPFLFIDEGGDLDFREFAEYWYYYPELFRYPVVYTETKYQNIPESEKSKFAGLIVSLNENQKDGRMLSNFYSKFNKNVILINDKLPHQPKLIASRFHIQDFRNQHRKFRDIYLEINKVENLSARSQKIRFQKYQKKGLLEKIKVKSNNSLIINYNYDLCWKSKNLNQLIYQSTPSQIFIFGHNNNLIECEH